MHLDLLLQGGTVISDSGRFQGSIGIAHGNGGVLSTQCTAILGSEATV